MGVWRGIRILRELFHFGMRCGRDRRRGEALAFQLLVFALGKLFVVLPDIRVPPANRHSFSWLGLNTMVFAQTICEKTSFRKA